jgi:preprotein translocase subunit SecE
VARETRRQRRAARAAASDGATSSRRSRAAQVRPSQQPVKQQTGRTARSPAVSSSYAELKKVDWPSRRQTFQGVAVVIIACTIVGFYLWGLDQVLRPLVDRVFL